MSTSKKITGNTKQQIVNTKWVVWITGTAQANINFVVMAEWSGQVFKVEDQA